jgi:hypothetical protein
LRARCTRICNGTKKIGITSEGNAILRVIQSVLSFRAMISTMSFHVKLMATHGARVLTTVARINHHDTMAAQRGRWFGRAWLGFTSSGSFFS